MSEKSDAYIFHFSRHADNRAALKYAGYNPGSNKIAGIMGCQIRAKNSKQLENEVSKRITSELPIAVEVLAMLAQSADSDAVKRAAAKDLCQLGGLDIQRTQQIDVDSRSDEQLYQSLAQSIKTAPENIKDMLREALQPTTLKAVK